LIKIRKEFLSELEELTGRNLRKGKPGPKIRIKYSIPGMPIDFRFVL